MIRYDLVMHIPNRKPKIASIRLTDGRMEPEALEHWRRHGIKFSLLKGIYLNRQEEVKKKSFKDRWINTPCDLGYVDLIHSTVNLPILQIHPGNRQWGEAIVDCPGMGVYAYGQTAIKDGLVEFTTLNNGFHTSMIWGFIP